jgi:hypothetical protein
MSLAAVQRQVPAAIRERLRGLGAENVQDSAVRYDVTFTSNGWGNNVEWRFPAQVKWSAEGLDGAKFSGVLEGNYQVLNSIRYSVQGSATGFAVGDIAVREMNPIAARQVQAHMTKNELRSAALSHFRTAVAGQLRELGADVSAGDVAVKEESAGSDRFRFQFRARSVEHKFSGDGEVNVGVDRGLHAGPIGIRRRDTVIGHVTKNIRAIRAALKK